MHDPRYLTFSVPLGPFLEVTSQSAIPLEIRASRDGNDNDETAGTSFELPRCSQYFAMFRTAAVSTREKKKSCWGVGQKETTDSKAMEVFHHKGQGRTQRELLSGEGRRQKGRAAFEKTIILC